MGNGRYDPGFVDQVLAEPGADKFRACFSCGTCSASCPISWLDGDYNPRRILQLVRLGAKDQVLASPAIWLCSGCDICFRRCPQQVRLSDLMRAIRSVATKEGYEPQRSPAHANKQACASCGLCVQTCPYKAIELKPIWTNGRRQMVVPTVNQFLCQECGICTVTCPVSAISVPNLGDQAMLAQIKGFASQNGFHRQPDAGWKPRIAAFVCGWCLYSERDRDDIAAIGTGTDVQVMKLPCLGRMDPLYALSALQEGIDGVLVVGCQLGDCHYRHGNLMAERRKSVLKAVLAAAGASQRVRFAHVSSAEKGVLYRLVEEMQTDLKALGPTDAGLLQRGPRVDMLRNDQPVPCGAVQMPTVG